MLGVVATLGFSGSALAANPPGPSGPPAFSVIDTNGDGRIDADEFARFHAQRMAPRAADGRLLRNAGRAPTFATLDTDGDGYLTRTEMAQRFGARGGPSYARGYGWGPGAGPGARPCGRVW